MLDRAWAIAYIEDNYAPIARKARIDNTDTSTGYKGILDNTFKQLGIAVADLNTAAVDDTLQDKLQALLTYYTLDKAYINFSVQTDTTFTNPGINSKKSIFFKNIKELLNRAKSEVQVLGYDVGDADYRLLAYYYE